MTTPTEVLDALLDEMWNELYEFAALRPALASLTDEARAAIREEWAALLARHAGKELDAAGWAIVPKVAVRCLITGNPFGTDTWMVGRPCQCAVCSAMLAAAPKP